MDLNEALLIIESLKKEKKILEEKNKLLEAELYNERKEKLLLALIHQKEKKSIAYVREFVPKSEKTNKVIINELEEIIKKERKSTIIRKKKFEDFDFEKYVTDEIVLKPDILVCPECGNNLTKIGEKIRYQIDADPINIKVVKIIKETYKCSKCNKSNNKIYYPLVNEVFDGSILTPGFASYLAYHKYELGIPFNHLEKHFINTLHIPISKSNMADYMARTAQILNPIYDRMKLDLLNTKTKVIHVDETTLTLSKKRSK